MCEREIARFEQIKDWDPDQSGIDQKALQAYIEEQIYTLPGMDDHRNVLTVLLTGSRAIGRHTPDSDVDIDVLCPERAYPSLQKACIQSGITAGRKSMWCPLSLRGDDWRRYFGGDSIPHFSVTTLESVRRQFQEYDDVALWIWTNSKIISDPNDQFRNLLSDFNGYPQDVLIRKLKYHWLLIWYWAIEVYPFHHRNGGQLLAATASLANAMLEMMEVWFLLDGKPYPYHEKLPDFVEDTTLGAKHAPTLRKWLDIALGASHQGTPVWERLDKANGLLLDDMHNAETIAIEEETTKALVTAGVERKWMDDYFANMDELLLGELGPVP
jgi:hypothetical protein